jgi:hypothetical protein
MRLASYFELRRDFGKIAELSRVSTRQSPAPYAPRHATLLLFFLPPYFATPNIVTDFIMLKQGPCPTSIMVSFMLL